jgi:hypothetical protein
VLPLNPTLRIAVRPVSQPITGPETNAVILQPGLIPTLAHAPLYTGPTVLTSHRDPVSGDLKRERLEYATDLTLVSESAFVR